MKPNEYLRLSALTDTNYTNINSRLADNLKLQRLVHGSLGLSGEAGEVVDMVKKAVAFGKPLDEKKLLEECGDVLYYIAVILRATGSDFEQVMKQNAEKLKARYPKGFTEKAAIERKDMK